MNLIVFGVLSPAFLFIPTFQPQPGIATLTKLKQVDWVETVLNAGLYTSFVIALTFGGATWAWNSGRTIGTLVATACLAAANILALESQETIYWISTPCELRALGSWFRTSLPRLECTFTNNTALRSTSAEYWGPCLSWIVTPS